MQLLSKLSDRNNLRGWVVSATENEDSAPELQNLAKLLMKAWLKREKIGKFYK